MEMAAGKRSKVGALLLEYERQWEQPHSRPRPRCIARAGASLQEGDRGLWPAAWRG